ncbi:hypothetical protein ScalyP_jg7204 [Parmales sp. scaly parma]|nr:hypothetical protein ScalyP_jg7204 [Parmales sp. scaly parma]
MKFLFTIVAACKLALAVENDWLLTKGDESTVARVKNECWNYGGDKICGLSLSNGLISRRFVVPDNSTQQQLDFGTVDILDQHNVSLFRRVVPEAQITIDDINYNVSTLAQEFHTGDDYTFAYCNRSSFHLTTNSDASSSFTYKTHTVTTPKVEYSFQPGTRFSPPDASWPPKGVRLEVTFENGDLMSCSFL